HLRAGTRHVTGGAGLLLRPLRRRPALDAGGGGHHRQPGGPGAGPAVSGAGRSALPAQPRGPGPVRVGPRIPVAARLILAAQETRNTRRANHQYADSTGFANRVTIGWSKPSKRIAPVSLSPSLAVLARRAWTSR